MGLFLCLEKKEKPEEEDDDDVSNEGSTTTASLLLDTQCFVLYIERSGAGWRGA